MNQHTKPCATCPFSRTVKPGELGGASTPKFVGQAFGPFFLPCHEQKGYAAKRGREGDFTMSQCAGAAIFRANIGRPPASMLELALPPYKETVFSDFVEFICHHERCSWQEAVFGLNILSPERMAKVEMEEAIRVGTIKLVPKEVA